MAGARLQLFFILAAVFAVTLQQQAFAMINPRPSWADSYSVRGKCYCKSTFDHGIGTIKLKTPKGRLTVREICSRLGAGPGIKKGTPVYNTIQCGHGPANTAPMRDEQTCPGRVDMGAKGCSKKGPKWDLSKL